MTTVYFGNKEQPFNGCYAPLFAAFFGITISEADARRKIAGCVRPSDADCYAHNPYGADHPSLVFERSIEEAEKSHKRILRSTSIIKNGKVFYPFK